MQVNSKELRQHLAEYLERASRGHTLEISMRGKPVARLTAIKDKQSGEEDALFGIWSDKQEMSVNEEMRELRKGRSF